jgi:hypothetical protein
MSSSYTRIPCPRPALIENFFVGKSNLQWRQKGFQIVNGLIALNVQRLHTER